MGQEITTTNFTKQDFAAFSARLRQETGMLKNWFATGRFSTGKYQCGLELEAWLVGDDYKPSASNEEFLKQLDHPLVCAELSQFNFELNSSPFVMDRKHETSLFSMEKELQVTWQNCRAQAEAMGLHAVAIGTMPTLREGMLTPAVRSDLNRYQALNEQLIIQNDDRYPDFHVEEGDSLYIGKIDPMMEAAATSLQVHFQVPFSDSVRAYNASLIASAALVAMAANSPYLYGRALWEESRIAICEQSVPCKLVRGDGGQVMGRVGFGSGYIRDSLLEPFLENIDCFMPLLPTLLDDAPETLPHLRLHNGTVWRWNRPLVEVDASGEPTLRIEQRVMSSGPTIADTMANTAFYLGLAYALSKLKIAPETQLPFAKAQENFYEAAKFGLSAQVTWLDGKVYDLQTLCVEAFLPLAREGLEQLGVASADISRYIDRILLPRARSGRTGAAWQKSFAAIHGADFRAMTEAYVILQKGGQPVHEWPV